MIKMTRIKSLFATFLWCFYSTASRTSPSVLFGFILTEVNCVSDYKVSQSNLFFVLTSWLEIEENVYR